MADEDRNEDPEPIVAEVIPIRYSVFQTTIGAMVARVYDVDPHNHTRDELAVVMDGVSRALDALERIRRTGYHGDGEDSYADRMARLVEYLRDGCFISDLHEDDDACAIAVQMTWDNVIATLSKKTNASKVSWVGTLDQLAWFRLESAIDGGETCGRGLARELAISPSTLGTLVRFYERAGRVRSRV